MQMVIHRDKKDYIIRRDHIRLAYKGCYTNFNLGPNFISADGIIYSYFQAIMQSWSTLELYDVELSGKFSEEEENQIRNKKPKTLYQRRNVCRKNF